MTIHHQQANAPLFLGQECMARTFLPVGQGAFYAECFHGASLDSLPVNVVYDCGSISKNSKSLIENAATSAFGPDNIDGCKRVIHAVFISHFHKDHIDGIPTLLQNYDVRRIYFPFLEPENKSLMKIWYRAQGINVNEFAFRFLENPRDAIASNVQLIAVGDKEDERKVSSLTNVGFHGNGQRIELATIIDSAWPFLSNAPFGKWGYVPFNIEADQFVNNVKKELQNSFPNEFVKGRPISGDKLDELYKKDKTSREAVIDAFKKAGSFEEINTNSLVLFSGICNRTALQQTISQSGKGQPRSLNVNYRNLPAGCLFTGDYNAQRIPKAQGRDPWRELYGHYQGYWPCIGCIQIPHHGSDNNFNPNFLSIPNQNTIYVISAKENSSKHPGKTVNNTFNQKGKEYYKATEDLNSMLRLCIK